MGSRPSASGPDTERGFSLLRHSREAFLAFTAAVAIGLLPVLWNETMGVVSSGFWTGLGAAAMATSVIMTRSDERGDIVVTLLVAAYLLAYALGSILSYVFVGIPSDEREAMLAYNLVLLGFGGLYYLFGIQIGADRKWGATFGVAIGCLGIMLHAVLRRDILADGLKLNQLSADGVIYGYQQLGDSLVLCTLVLMAAIKRWGGAKYLIALVALATVSIVILFVIPSRSAAIFGSLAILGALVLMAPVRGRAVILGMLVCGAVVVSQVSLLNLASGTRYMTLVDEDKEDQSQAKRDEILSEGIAVIGEHPVLGYWAFQLERMGRPGWYVHNALDIWAQAGVVPFLLFLGLWAWSLWLCVKRLKDPDPDGRARALESLPMLFFALSSWVVSRNAAYVLLLFALGYAAALPRGRHEYATRHGSSSRRRSGSRRGR